MSPSSDPKHCAFTAKLVLNSFLSQHIIINIRLLKYSCEQFYCVPMRELLTFWSGRGGGEMTLALMVRSGIMLLNPDCLENKFNKSDRAAFTQLVNYSAGTKKEYWRRGWF